MSNGATWCDTGIIQAVANTHNCVIHITESDFNKPDGTIVYPESNTYYEKKQTVIFIGYINSLTIIIFCCKSLESRRCLRYSIFVPKAAYIFGLAHNINLA